MYIHLNNQYKSKFFSTVFKIRCNNQNKKNEPLKTPFFKMGVFLFLIIKRLKNTFAIQFQRDSILG